MTEHTKIENRTEEEIKLDKKYYRRKIVYKKREYKEPTKADIKKFANRRFVIRDKVSKEVLIRDLGDLKIRQDFSSLSSAVIIMNSLQFGLGNMYEIYDTRTKQILDKSNTRKVKQE